MTQSWMTLSYLGVILLLIVVLGAAAVVFFLILVGKIDLSQVLTEPDSTKASLSRFQFLLFTFVIAGLFLLLSVESGAFVNVPDSVLALLGISAGSYTISKGIQLNGPGPRAAANAKAAADAAASASAAANAAAAHAAAAKAMADSTKPPGMGNMP
jgi:uncharacterized BrkB/YihY/UPF0761 family membrane protein